MLDYSGEINVLANCDSPHVTKYLGSWLVPKTTTLAIAMEYMGGGSVQDLCRESPLNEKNCSVVLRDVVKALKYLRGRKDSSRRQVREHFIERKRRGTIGRFWCLWADDANDRHLRRKTFAGRRFGPRDNSISGGGGGQVRVAVGLAARTGTMKSRYLEFGDNGD